MAIALAVIVVALLEVHGAPSSGLSFLSHAAWDVHFEIPGGVKYFTAEEHRGGIVFGGIILLTLLTGHHFSFATEDGAEAKHHCIMMPLIIAKSLNIMYFFTRTVPSLLAIPSA